MEGAEASSSFCLHDRRTVKWSTAYQSGVEVPCTPGAVFHSIDVAARQHPCDRGAMQSRPVEHHPFPFDHYLFVDTGHASLLIVQ